MPGLFIIIAKTAIVFTKNTSSLPKYERKEVTNVEKPRSNITNVGRAKTGRVSKEKEETKKKQSFYVATV